MPAPLGLRLGHCCTLQPEARTVKHVLKVHGSGMNSKWRGDKS